MAMGGLLDPALANFFLGHIESSLFDDIVFKPTMYIRYEESYIDLFFHCLNTQHPIQIFLSLKKNQPQLKQF